MEYRVRFIIIITIVFLLISGVTALAYKNDDKNVINKDIKIMKDIFIIREYLKNKGEVVGDIVALVSYFNNEGTVNGDILSGSFTSDIKGVVKGDVRALSWILNIDGEIRRNITAFSKQLNINEDAIVYGSITTYSKKFNIHGEIDSDIRGVVDTIYIDGKIRGDVDIIANEITFGKNANVLGNFTYRSDNEIKIPKKYINGDTKFIKGRSSYTEYLIRKNIEILILIKDIIFGVCLCIIAFILSKLMPNELNDLTLNIHEKKHYTFFYGLGIIIISLFIILALFITIVGIPLSIIFFSLFSILAYLVKIPVGTFIGNYFFRHSENIALKTVFGLIIILLLSLMPYIGKIINIVAIIIGFGAIYFKYKDKIVFIRNK